LKTLLRRLRFFLLPLAVGLAACLLLWQSGRFGAQEEILRRAENRLKELDRTVDSRLTDILRDTSEQFFRGVLTQKIREASYFLYSGGALYRWTDAEPDLPFLLSDTLKDGSLAELPNGTFWLRMKRKGDLTAVGLLLVRHRYSYENRYLRNDFNPALDLPTGMRSGNGPAFHAPDGSEITTLSTEGFTLSADDTSVTALWWVVILLLLSGIRSWAGSKANRRGKAILVLLLLRGWTLLTGSPAYLYATGLFSPSVYASNWFGNSLGDLLLNALTVLAVASLFPARIRSGKAASRLALSLLFALFLYADFLLVKGLVMDSRISFNIEDLSSVDVHTFIALTCIAFIYTAQVLSLMLFFPSAGWRWNLRYTVAALVSVSVFTAMNLQSFTQEKELEERTQVAQRVGMQRDPVAEYLLGAELQKISRDPDIAGLARNGPSASDAVEAMIASRYLRSYLSRFEFTSSVADSLHGFFRWAEQEGQPTDQAYLYSLSDRLGRMEYVAFVPLCSTAGDTLAAISVNLRPRVFASAQGFPELFISGMPRERELPENYSYAIYTDGSLAVEYGRFPYAVNGKAYEVSGSGEYHRMHADGFDHMVYSEDGKTVVVSKPATSGFSFITLFSWVFTFFGLFLYGCHVVIRLVRGTPVQSSLTRRIRVSVFMLVVLSFIGIGPGTARYIFTKYEDDQRRTISEHLNGLWIELDEMLRSEQDFSIPVSSELGARLQTIAKNTNIDYNIFDSRGRLVFSSQPRIYEQGIVSERMNPHAISHLRETRQTQFLDREQVGGLNYIAAYAPFLSPQGNMTGFLQLPYFEKQKERSREISGFLSALLNIYVLLFALAVFLTAFISSRITQPLSLIQEKMAGVRLGRKNEPIRYAAKDEIGQLVDEYNRMLKELSDSAERLAQGEREGAWREMAKQVAHEIKNPLTPMKLSVQHLQRAWKEHREDREAMTEKMAQTLIQQIDTLSSIASEFSNFAQMPRPEPVVLDIRTVLEKSIELFRDSSDHRFSFATLSSPVLVKADPAQLNRVFSNLLKNAVQAVPEGREGRIDVELVLAGDSVRISIRDNGVGISEEQRSRIFVPNFTTKSGGTGLGLAMVKNIVEQCGGRVTFESTPGTGTVFTLELPLSGESV
jgi:signal transduction histidine kinase